MATTFDRKKAETVIPQLEKGVSLVNKNIRKVSESAKMATAKATEAKQSADIASEKADEAKETVDGVKTDVEQAQADIETVKSGLEDVGEEVSKASKTATNYIKTNIDGLHVTDNVDNVGTDDENSVLIDSTAVNIINNGSKAARFSKNKIELGSSDEYSTIEMCNSNLMISTEIIEDTRGFENKVHAIYIGSADGDIKTRVLTLSNSDSDFGIQQQIILSDIEDGIILRVSDVYFKFSGFPMGITVKNSFTGEQHSFLDDSTPHIVASGTNNNWNYKRYSDGTYEATRVYETGNTTLRNATEGAYSYADWTTINPPSFSKGISSVIGGCHNAGKWVSAYASSNTINFKVFAPASVTTSRAYTVDLKIEGTW